jgi:hypothetical protein
MMGVSLQVSLMGVFRMVSLVYAMLFNRAVARGLQNKEKVK